eukprot:926268-Amphidinium_carterae.1
MAHTTWFAEREWPENVGNRCIPLKLWGDGVQCLGLGKSWGQGVNCVTFGSLLCRESSLLQNILLALVWKKCKPETMVKIFRVLTWSFEAVWAGRHPTQNYLGHAFPEGSVEAHKAGTLLANGFYGALICATGDLEWQQEGLGILATGVDAI